MLWDALLNVCKVIWKWKTLPQCKAVFLWKTVDCFFYKVTKSRKVEWKSSCLQISGSSPIPGSSCSSDTTWCCNLLERRRKLSSTQWLQDAHWVLLFIQRGTAGSRKSGAQVWTQLPPQWLVWLEENLTIPLSPNLQNFWLKACEWMLLHKSWQLESSAFWKLAKLYDGRTSIALEFSAAFVLWGSMFVYICESMGHRTMKILKGQEYA